MQLLAVHQRTHVANGWQQPGDLSRQMQHFRRLARFGNRRGDRELVAVKGLHGSTIEMYFTSRNSSSPHGPPSRPIPENFTPPNGACGTAGSPSFTPTMPYS